MKKRWNMCIIGGILAAMLCCQFMWAAEEAGKIISYGVSEKNVVLYIQDPGEEYEIQCKIGVNEAADIESHRISEEPVPVETIILLDNSLSVVNEYRPKINTIMSELAANRMNGELFTVAVFSDQIQYLVQKSADYTQVKQAIDGITYNNQETYLTDILYELLSEINAEKNITLKRIVIISDGVDNKSIGYTKEELYKALESTPYPIFTLGCKYKDNNEQLKNMFALSRMTGGESWLLDDVSDSMTVVNGVASLNNSVKVMITPDDKDCDGTKKGLQLSVTSSGQSIQDSVEVTMPFGTVKETTEAPATTQAETTTVAETTKEELSVEEEASKFPLILATAGGAVLIVLLGGGTVIYLRKKKEEKNRFVAAEPRMSGADSDSDRNEHRTQMMGEAGSNKRSTMFAWDAETAHTLILEDINNPIKRFEVSLDSPILVGYNDNCQIRLNYEETVSGRHCRIYCEGGKIYVENLSQSNGTYMDNKRIVKSAEIYTGCVLRLGNLYMKVEIR